MKIHLTREFDSEAEFAEYMAASTGEQRSAAITVTASEVVSAPTQVEPEITAERDSDDLPYNTDYHASPKSFTEDGLWRSKRGKADEAKAARAQFKAAGGVAPAMPVAAPAMPTMPVAAPAAILPPPVDFARLVGKITGMMQRGKLGNESITALYAKVGATSGAQFETNESLRAALFGELCAIEPELA